VDEATKAAQEEDAAWFSTWGASIYGDETETTRTGSKPARWSGGGGGGGGRGRESSGGSFDKWGAPDVKPGARKRTARGIGSRRKFPRDDHWKDPRSEDDDEDDEDDDLADFIVDDAPTGGPPHADDVLTDEPTPYAGGVATARDWLTGTGGAGGGVGSRYWSEPPATLPGRRSGSWGEHREPGGWGVNDGAGGSVRVRKKPAAPPIEVIDEQPSEDDVDRTDDVDRSLQGASEGKGKSRSYPWRRKGRRKGKGKKGYTKDGQENAGANAGPQTGTSPSIPPIRKRPAVLDEPRIPHTKLPKKAFTQATLAFS
jgi:hypothetical protein